MSAGQRTYKNNLHRRYSGDVAVLRARVRQELDTARVDVLGARLADYVASYRERHGVGATRREALAYLGVIDGLAPIPEGLPSLFRREWQKAAASEVFSALRRRGWVTYDGTPRSLDVGPRHLMRAA